MPTAVIENPIINSPFEEPRRHWQFDDNGITDAVVEGRRPSTYFVPIAQPRKKERQLTLEAEWNRDRIRDNDDINFVRSRVKLWRDRGYPDITPVTRLLLEYWQDPRRDRRLFFCQIEALETLIYLAEAAAKSNDQHFLNRLRDCADQAGTPLFRQACKMATGSGKTVVMAMLIAWHTLNKRAYPSDGRFNDAFLIVSPGITIRDRLRVLLPSDEGNYYEKMEIVPVEHRPDMGVAKIIITNFHAFKQKERGDAGRLTKAILTGGQPGAFTESPAQMVRRVCRDFGNKQGLIVINDEAHHCYRSRPKPVDSEEKLTGDDRKEAEDREKAASLWITGLEAVHTKLGVKAVYDLSATPFYLSGSGYQEGTLFPWVVSDFALIDAIESGIVKIPRVPVSDDAMQGSLPTYRDLWPRIREDLPTKSRKDEAQAGPPHVPIELEGALQVLYAHYEKQYREWEADADGRTHGRTPPVFIVVCNNTSVSKLVFDYIAGYETDRTNPDGTPYVAPGKLGIFNNADHNRWLHRPNTILVDTQGGAELRKMHKPRRCTGAIRGNPSATLIAAGALPSTKGIGMPRKLVSPTRRGLTPKQARFVAEYLTDCNATQAAIRAGYSSKNAGKIGPKLVGKSRVQEAIRAGQEKLRQKLAITAEQVLLNLARIAFSDIGEVLDWSGGTIRLKPWPQISEDARRTIRSLRVKRRLEGKGVQVELIDVQLWSKSVALATLAKHFGLLQPQATHQTDVPVPRIQPTLEERRARLLSVIGRAQTVSKEEPNPIGDPHERKTG